MTTFGIQHLERDILAEKFAITLFRADTIFKALAVGQPFHFPGFPTYTYIKVNEAGWYRTGTGKRFRTGTRTAVCL